MKIKPLRTVLTTILIIPTLILTACGSQENLAVSSSNEKIILGNIITMDDSMPKAEAVAIRDGYIVSVGSEAEVRSTVSESATVLNYKGKSVYPGFMEPHAHGMLAGQRAIGQADLFQVGATDYKKYEKVIKKFIKDNPDAEVYVAAGWIEDGTPIDHTYLDNIIMDKPLIMNTDGGHSSLLNTKAMEVFGFDDEAVKEYGTDRIHVDENGHPNGYVCEEPAIDLLKKLPASLSDIKEYILEWQNIALSEGITTVGDAGVDLLSELAIQAYKELQDEGKLQIRTYGYLLAEDNLPDPAGKVQEAVKLSKELNGEYFKIIGFKAFLDGVTEAHTSWVLDDYSDTPGYKGVQRFNDKEKMVDLLVESQKNGLSLQVHSIGDGASRFMLDCIEESQKITGDNDQRNILSHLELVSPEDIQKMADTNSIAAVAPLWTPAFPSETYISDYIGKDRYDNTYPIKSFFEKGAKVVFHSDYPISPDIDIPLASFVAQNRWTTENNYGRETTRNEKEAIDRKQSLEAVTTNVAYALHEENRMGSITPGKLANFTVLDKDFLECTAIDVSKAKVLATIIDGNVVYKK